MTSKVMKIEKSFSYKNISTLYQSHNYVFKLLKTIICVPINFKL